MRGWQQFVNNDSIYGSACTSYHVKIKKMKNIVNGVFLSKPSQHKTITAIKQMEIGSFKEFSFDPGI